MEAKLHEVMVGHARYNRHDGQFGIEIETETNSAYRDPPSKFWGIVGDGSLRNYGREYVLMAPMSFGKGLEEALEEFRGFTKNIPFNQGSNSTSVHVHINMLNESVRTLMNTLVTYTLLEPLLISICGEERKSNLFCLPFHDTGSTVQMIQEFITSLSNNQFQRSVRGLNSDNMKYSGLNLAPLRNLGSIEVRTMEGTTDVDRISSWVKNFESMVEFSRQNITPVDVLGLYLDDKDSFLEKVGISSKQFNPDLIQPLLHKGRSCAYDFASVYYDWEKVFSTFEASQKKRAKNNDKSLDDNLASMARRVIRNAESSGAPAQGGMEQDGESAVSGAVRPTGVGATTRARQPRPRATPTATPVADGLVIPDPAHDLFETITEIIFEEEV